MKKNIRGIGNEGQFGPITIVGTTPIPFTIEISNLDNLSFQLNTTGTVAGAWTFQADNRYSTDAQFNAAVNAGTWPAMPTSLFSTVAAAAGAPTDQYVQSLVPIAARAIRVTFTPTSGAGTASLAFFGKGAQ